MRQWILGVVLVGLVLGMAGTGQAQGQQQQQRDYLGESVSELMGRLGADLAAANAQVRQTIDQLARSQREVEQLKNQLKAAQDEVAKLKSKDSTPAKAE